MMRDRSAVRLDVGVECGSLDDYQQLLYGRNTCNDSQDNRYGERIEEYKRKGKEEERHGNCPVEYRMEECRFAIAVNSDTHRHEAQHDDEEYPDEEPNRQEDYGQNNVEHDKGENHVANGIEPAAQC